jgi:hypothetical protein
MDLHETKEAASGVIMGSVSMHPSSQTASLLLAKMADL